MSRLPDRLPGHVDAGDANHLFGSTAGRNKGADSNAHRTDVPLLHKPRPTPAGSPARVGRVALERMRSLLSEREMAVVESVDEFRYMSAGHIERLHFRSHASGDTAARIRRRVLERLTTARLLTRTERVIGGVRVDPPASSTASGQLATSCSMKTGVEVGGRNRASPFSTTPSPSLRPR